MIERRVFLGGMMGAGLLAAVPAGGASSLGKAGRALSDTMAALEKESGGRLGVAVLDKAGAASFAWRGGERFAMCSTFKAPLAAATLDRVDRGLERLDRAIPVGRDDLVHHSPFAETRVGGSATVAELCEATVQRSDNAAANLLLAPLGGPDGFTRFMRESGDAMTRLDRIEPFMNDVQGADPRDTTTPDAMVASLDRFLLGDALKPASRARLLAWMAGNKTGDGRIRAGVPQGWTVADKTGTGGQGSYNDIGLIQPPGRAPLLIAIYLAESPLDWDPAEAILAKVTRAIVAAL